MDDQSHHNEAGQIAFAHHGPSGWADNPQGQKAAQNNKTGLNPVFIKTPQPADKGGHFRGSPTDIAKIQAGNDQAEDDIHPQDCF